MKQVITSAVVVILMLTSCNAQEKSKIINSENLEGSIDKLVKEYQDLDIFSGVVLVAEKGITKYHKAFGLANRETNTPNTFNTKFDIGSMNKSFTKTLILQLMEEGKLNVSDPLGKFLDGFPEFAANNVTILDLLKHKSGYGGYWGPDFVDLPIDQKRIPALVERIKKLPLEFKPGTEVSYSNAGYILLGAIVAEITGNTYHENVVNRIIEPLNLTNTYVIDKSEVPERSIGYYKDMKGNISPNTGFVEVPNPDGGFQSTPQDIVKFYTEYFYGTKLLNKETKDSKLFFGNINSKRNSKSAQMMAGGFPGANTAYFEVLRDQLSVIVFANMDEPVAERLGTGILAILRGQEPASPTLPAIQNVYKSYKKYGLKYIKENFNSLISNFHAEDPKGIILNRIGYEFLQENDLSSAIEIFKLNTELFPEDANTWDSLGEAYYSKGEKKESIKYYKKALSIDPNMPSAIEMVKKLENNN